MQRLRALQRLRPLAEQPCSSQVRWMAAQPAPEKADDTMEVTVNGATVRVAKGVNVLQACETAGVDVPR